MPRTGGESGKLGNRYEAVWTVDSLLDVLTGDALEVEVEPFDPNESLGIEFKKQIDSNTEFHSAKRQTSGQLWSLAELTRIGENGRSILDDLIGKLTSSSANTVVFVSGTTARDLEELWQAAMNANDASAFKQRVNAMSVNLRQEFEDRLLKPRFNNDWAFAFDYLRRIRVVGWTETEMIRRIEQRIRAMLYRPDGTLIDALATRLFLADMVLTRFGRPIRKCEIMELLASHGVFERDWTRPNGPRETVERRNGAYLKHVEAELIDGERILRVEAKQAAEALVEGRKRVVLLGLAGLGKSCTVTQTLHLLQDKSMPCLAVRLDLQASALTSQTLGQELGLPESPVLVLAGIANGLRCVLVLDQVDAISFFSGRNQRLWDVFEELLLEADRYPQMGILLACRSVDAEHDPRLRRLLANGQNTLQVEIGLLPLDIVKDSLVRAGLSPDSLDAMHLELLRTPLHLSLYLQGGARDNPKFRGVQELLGRYWKHKRRLVTEQLQRESHWYEIIKRLVERLSRDQTLSAPRTILDPFDEADVAAMASQNVIVLEAGTVRFFHESFFDYCCARLFAEAGKTLLDFLLADGSEQHLFRRAQVRQILEFQRENNFEAYFRDLRELLTDGRIRYHLKKLAIDWLGRRDDPRPAEWQLLRSVDSSQPIGFLAKRIAWGSPAWAKLLNSAGVWQQWLDSGDSEAIQSAVRILSLPANIAACSTEVAQLFRPYVDGKKLWREEFDEIFYFKEAFLNRQIFELLKDATSARLLKPRSDHDWYHYKELAEARPDWAVELLAVMLEIEADKADNEDSVDKLGSDFIVEAAQRAPTAFASVVLPRVVAKVKTWDPAERHNTWGARRIWEGRHPRTYHFESALEIGLEIALEKLAADEPETLDSICTSAEQLPNNILSALLLKSWSLNGRRFGDKIVTYLLGDPERLVLGYVTWGTGNGRAAIARGAVKAASPDCSADNYLKLETAILSLTTDDEREDPKRFGYHRMLLLECLPSDRISRAAKLQFEELKRKFPWAKFEMPKSGITSGFVGPPVPSEAAKHMTDDQWLQAMRKYSNEREPRTSRDFLKGGTHELAVLLRSEAQMDKERFARLALRMEDTITPEYFGAIMSGITSTQTEGSDSAEIKELKQRELAVDEIVPVIERMHVIAAEDFARNICWAIRYVAHREPRPELLSIISDYARHHADPEKDTWEESAGGGQKHWGGDPHFQGMNSVRGAAAEAVAAFLFADPALFAQLEPTVLSVIHDQCIAVRSCAILCLVAMLNFDQDRAVKLFLELCENAEEALGTHYADQFIHYGTYRHYSSLRPVLLKMLQALEDNRASVAARQITVASFHQLEALEDLKIVVSGNATRRKEAADVFARNVGRSQCRELCHEWLTKFFRDSDADVREAASGCFRNLPSNSLSTEAHLISNFIDSPACLDNSHQLIHALEEATEWLPDVICRIPERLIAEHRSAPAGENIESRRWIYHLPALVTRLYEQTADRDIKRRCLDIIDGMLELNVSDIEKELAQVER